jgi:hypothetical protein
MMCITGLNRPNNENENDDKIQLCLITYISFQMLTYMKIMYVNSGTVLHCGV